MSDTFSSQRPSPSRNVGGYELYEEIGSGGMSRVYRAVKSGQQGDYAVKVVRIEDVDAEYERRLRREPEVQRGIGHENIVELVDWFRERDEFFLVMEYVNGRSLSQLIHRESGPLPFTRARNYLRQALRAVDHLHSLGIIHRDIKPSNLLIAWDDNLKLADFGIAKFSWQQGETKTQKGLGTPEYMSPEQASGRSIDSRTDIYSLGITFFEMLTARKPYSRQEETPMAYAEVIRGILTDPLPDPRSFQPGLSAGVVRLLNKATAKDPNDRFQTAREFMGALDIVEDADAASPTVVVDTRRDNVAAVAGGLRSNSGPVHPSSGVRPEAVDRRDKERVGNGPIWFLLAVIVLVVGGYFGYQWYQQRQAVRPGEVLTDARALEITNRVAKDYGDFARKHIVPGLSALYADNNVEYFRLKRATRSAIEEDSRKFYSHILQTDQFDVEVKSARAVNDSTIQSEWWISYDRLKDDGSRLRGLTSNLITLRQWEGEWLIARQTQKWINRENMPPPVADTSTVVSPDTARASTPDQNSEQPQVRDLNAPSDSAADAKSSDGGGIFNRNEPQESRVRR